MSTEKTMIRGAEAFRSVEGNIAGIAIGEMSASPAVSENPCTFARLLSGPWEVFKLPRMSYRGRVGNGESRSL